jgi:hypothetical protein
MGVEAGWAVGSHIVRFNLNNNLGGNEATAFKAVFPTDRASRPS